MKFRDTVAAMLLNKKYWFFHFIVVSVMSIIGLIYLGDQTYSGAPPLGDYIDNNSKVVISKQDIKDGERIFHNRGLMHYGSFWGDGAGRGPDFSAEALHISVNAMQEFYEQEALKVVSISKDKNNKDIKTKRTTELSPDEKEAIGVRVKREVRENRWDESTNTIKLVPAQVYAVDKVYQHYVKVFTDRTYPEAFFPTNYIKDLTELKQLSAFIYWGGWVAAANRPNENYSYTHNWPYDPQAGNHPTRDTYFWSFASLLVLFAGIMLVLYIYGQMKATNDDPFRASYRSDILLSTPDLENGVVRPTQKQTYKFFVLAAIAFGMQVLAGFLSLMDFANPHAEKIAGVLPFTVLRSYHTLLQIYWLFMCWVGYTIFFLPRVAAVPKYQKALIEVLFYMCVIVGLGGVVGVYSGYNGIIGGTWAYWFGSQGWEFMELGRFFQYVLLAAFSLWIFIIYRGVKPWVTKKTFWSIPAWLLWGSGIMVFFLFFGLFATPESNWAVADFWRWMVVHMWVEVTFEVFTTVIVAYILVQLGMIDKVMAERVVYLAVILFLATATLGVAHNFYWIAKPTGVIALGSTFSTLQILPLLLLTLDAWRVRKEGLMGWDRLKEGKQKNVMEVVWLFILGVNFWNIFGAGVLGSLINLPIINYFEHATYMTGNHAHAAMFGVKGNIALAGVLFCCQHLILQDGWNPKLVKTSFWMMNIGLALMMFMALFPAGLYQIGIIFEQGYWAARTQEVLTGEVFKTFITFRGLGITIFSIGMLMMVWFIITRMAFLRPETDPKGGWEKHENEWNPDSPLPTDKSPKSKALDLSYSRMTNVNSKLPTPAEVRMAQTISDIVTQQK